MTQQINLFNPIFLKQKRYFSAKTMLQALIPILAGVLVFYLYAGFQIGKLTKQVMEVSSQLDRETAKLAKIKADYGPKTGSNSLSDEVKRLEKQLKERETILTSSQGRNFGKNVGFAQYMQAFSRQAVSGLWLTGFTIASADNRMIINGRALRPELVPIYIRRLNQEQVMQGHTFGTFDLNSARFETGKNGAFGFFEFSLKSSEAVADAPPPTAAKP
jgi:hypothetical protein